MLLRLPITWFSRKLFYCLLRDDISQPEMSISIFETFMTTFHELPNQLSYKCVSSHTCKPPDQINMNAFSCSSKVSNFDGQRSEYANCFANKFKQLLCLFFFCVFFCVCVCFFSFHFSSFKWEIVNCFDSFTVFLLGTF